jgi:hypothetical protein
MKMRGRGDLKGRHTHFNKKTVTSNVNDAKYFMFSNISTIVGVFVRSCLYVRISVMSV